MNFRTDHIDNTGLRRSAAERTIGVLERFYASFKISRSANRAARVQTRSR